jgi:hypothetical protein
MHELGQNGSEFVRNKVKVKTCLQMQYSHTNFGHAIPRKTI